jgi:hypothetical protein
MYVFANGAGLVELLCTLSIKYTAPIILEKARESDSASLARLDKELVLYA